MPPDIGGYQRQIALLLPRLVPTLRDVTWLGAVRDRPLEASPDAGRAVGRWAVPAFRIPRRVRGAADLLVVSIASFVLLVRRPNRDVLWLLSPTMVGAAALVRLARWRRWGVVVRYPTAGDLQHAGGRRVARVPGVIVVGPAASQTEEDERLAVEQVRNAVDVPVADGASGRDDGERSIVFVGRLIRRKRVDLLLQAWAQAADRLPGWRLVVVGDGGSEADSIEDELAVTVSTGAVPRCDLVGGVPDARPYISTADIFAFPSVREGLPNSVLEAMAAGVPVLADPRRAVEWFGDPVPLLEWSGEDADLADAIVAAALDIKGREDVARDGRAYVSAHHDPSAVAMRYRQLFEDSLR